MHERIGRLRRVGTCRTVGAREPRARGSVLVRDIVTDVSSCVSVACGVLIVLTRTVYGIPSPAGESIRRVLSLLEVQSEGT
jgi:hypothetical protein